MESHAFYSDGDILIIVENISFKLHKKILSLSSMVFRDMLDRAVSSQGEEIPRIEIEQENAHDFNSLLSFIYPEKYAPITWNNVEGLLRTSDKFMVDSATVACKNFLAENYRRNLMLTFKLADVFNFDDLYKESSKLILNNYQKFKCEPVFEELSEDAKAALNERYIKFFFGLCSIAKDTIMKDYIHRCKNLEHHDTLEIEWKKRIKNLTIPPPSPSTIYKKIFFEIEGIHNRKCNNHFTDKYLPSKISELLGEFEPLGNADMFCSPNHYIYIEK